MTKDTTLDDFRRAGFLTDVEVESVDGHKFKAHKDILHAVDGLLPYTKRCQPQVEIALEKAVVEELLNFIYTGSCSIDPCNREGLLVAANKYKLTGLLKLLGNHFVANVTLENALDFHQVAESNFCQSIGQTIFLFIVHNFSKVKGKEELNTIALKRKIRNCSRTLCCLIKISNLHSRISEERSLGREGNRAVPHGRILAQGGYIQRQPDPQPAQVHKVHQHEPQRP